MAIFLGEYGNTRISDTPMFSGYALPSGRLYTRMVPACLGKFTAMRANYATAWQIDLLWMEEILHHFGWLKPFEAL